jgi:hypothetical protein
MKEQENVGRKLANSPVSEELLGHGSRKFGPTLALIVLLKCCAVVSCKLESPRLSVMHVAPTRQGKSFTSNEVMGIFDEEFYLDLGSDFTMNSLSRYKHDIEDGKCLFVNDGTTLLASKSQRTKDRLVGGLSELVSDGCYTYMDFGQKFTLRGAVTVNFNITSESFINNKDRLFGLTFSERFLTVHHAFAQRDKNEWVARMATSKNVHFGEAITVDDIATKVEIASDYFRMVQHLAKEFSYDSLTSPVACQDLLKATLSAHSALNRRNRICVDDLMFVKRTQPYLTNPFSPYDGKIIRLRAQGLSIREVCKEIGKRNYEQQVQRVIKRAELRGILSPPEQSRLGLTSATRKGGESYG